MDDSSNRASAREGLAVYDMDSCSTAPDSFDLLDALLFGDGSDNDNEHTNNAIVDTSDEILLMDVDVTDLELDFELLNEFAGDQTRESDPQSGAAMIPPLCSGHEDAPHIESPPAPSPLPAAVHSQPFIAPAPAPVSAPRARKLRPIKPAATPSNTKATTPAATGSLEAVAHSIHTSAVQRTTTGRKRVKDELESLREYVARLEAQLRELHRVVCKTETTHGDTSSSGGINFRSFNERSGVAIASALSIAAPSSSSSSSSPSSFNLWKRVARRQLDARRRSETENARLRDLLEAQLKLAQSLARALRRQPSPSDLELRLCDLEEFQWRLSLANPRDEGAAIYTRLAAALDVMHLSVDSVLADAGLCGTVAPMSIPAEGCAGRIKTDRATGDVYLELASSIVVPFGLDATSAGFWSLINSSSLELSPCDVQRVDHTRSLLYAQYRMVIPARHGQVAMRGHIVGKRIVDRVNRRVVFVWCTASECDDSVLSGAEASQLHETGWTAITERPRMTRDASLSSVIQTVLRMHPCHGARATTNGSQSRISTDAIQDFADAVVMSFEQTFDQAQRMTETAILQSIAVRL